MDDPTQIDLITPFELHGSWWRMGKDQEGRVSGCLSYSPDCGLQLQLYDDLPGEGWFNTFIGEPNAPIWGEVSGFGGREAKVSLFAAFRTNQPNDPNSKEMPASHTIFFVNRAVVGAHAAESNSLSIVSIHFSIVDFESFVNTKPVAVLKEGNALQISYEPAKEIEFNIEEPSAQARISTLVGSSSSLYGRNGTITYRNEMSITPTKPMPLDDCSDIIFSLTNFFLICAREAIEIRYIRGFLESGEMIASFGNMRNRKKKKPRASDWVLTLKDIGTPIQEVINGWFLLAKKLKFVGPVFFSELSSPSPMQDARFFHFAGCLEAFHREVVQGKIGKFMPKKDYRDITNALMGHLPPTLPDGLKDAMYLALSHANDHSFAERIDILFNLLEPETQRLLAEEPQRFLAAIKHSRNKLAHVSDDTPGETFNGKEFAHANLSLRGWISALMLKQCGIAEVIIRERMLAMNYFYWGPFKFNSLPPV